MSNLEIITTGDGSNSLLNKALNETYHSVHGALRESLHVFIEHGLEFLSNEFNTKSVNIFEVGFGTGLNALLAVQSANAQNLQVHYTSIEMFPLEADVWTNLNYTQTEEQKELFERLHQAKWEEDVLISDQFTLNKVQGNLQTTSLPSSNYNLIFFDAFAPSKQPEMWSLEVLGKIFNAMTQPGVFVTYCAKGQLKRDLKSLGLEVQTLDGPPGKKEMVRAIKR
jgi:tRNA U34 5-methylaminomethyl-2-thiouridine-forming methyltransferase MnmC